MNRKGNTLLGILFILIGLGLIGTSVYMTLNKPKENEKEEEKKEEEEEETKKVTVVLNDNEKNKLFNLLPIEKDFYYSTGSRISPFKESKVKVTDMDKNWIQVRVAKSTDKDTRGTCTEEDNKSPGLCDFTISTKTMSNIIKNNYDIDNFELSTRFHGNFLFNCDNETFKDHYICSASGGGYTFSDEKLVDYFGLLGDSAIYKYVKADKDKDYMYVYYKYLFVDYSFDSDDDNLTAKDITFKLFTSSERKVVVSKDDLNANDYYEEDGKTSFSDKIIKEYENKMQDYKITYKIDGENYKLVSVEPIKNETKK